MLVSQGQADTTFDPPGSLAYGQTYYWRIDEVNKSADGTINKGSVWSFTAEPYAYPLAGTSITATASSAQLSAGPENTINGSGLDATGTMHGSDSNTMWMTTGQVLPNWIQYQFDKTYKLWDMKVWNSNLPMEAFIGFGAKDVKIEYSTDGTTWTALANVPQFARASGLTTYTANTTVSFGGDHGPVCQTDDQQLLGRAAAGRPGRSAVLLCSASGAGTAAGGQSDERRHYADVELAAGPRGGLA